MRMIPDEFDRGNSALNHDYRTARRMAIAATQFEKRFEEAWSTAREKVSVSENPIMQKWHANALAAKSKHSGIHSSAFSDNVSDLELNKFSDTKT